MLTTKTLLPEQESGKKEPRRDESALESDPRWECVERVISSPRFSKSIRLCAFLRFVCKETLLDPGEHLNEQRIGVNVFERKVDYDSADDNIVRSHASRLREKLEAYYLAEGRLDPIRIHLNRGSYKPQFEGISSQLVEEPEPVMAQAPQRPVELAAANKSRRSDVVQNRVTWLLAIALLIMSCVAGYEWRSRRTLDQSLEPSSPAMRAFWHDVFPAGRRALIVSGDSSLVLHKDLTGRVVTLSEYMTKGYLTGALKQPQTKADIATWVANRRLTSVADLEMASQLLRIPEIVAARPQIRFARDLDLADLKESNAIIIGAQPADPWLSLFQSKLNFVITDDDQHTRVINHSPHTGESAVYEYQPENLQHVAYGVVALVPNLSGDGMVLIVEGTSIAGTEAAGDFVTDPSQLGAVLETVLKQYGKVKPFELLLETTDLNGSAPLSRVLAMRVTP